MAAAGTNIDVIIDMACLLFEGSQKDDVRDVLTRGGTAYLVESYRHAKGFHFKPE